MRTSRRAYKHDPDYMRIRDFLIDTFALYQQPVNWLLERWNFCRYLVVPFHTYYNIQHFSVPTQPRPHYRDELPYWEASIAIWEDENGEIVGVVNTENEEAGEAWFQIHPEYTHLYAEMVDYAEEHLTNWVDGLGYLKLYVNTETMLEEIVRGRGYKRLAGGTRHLEYTLEPGVELLPPQLPEGFVIKSVLEEDEPGKRSALHALAFGGRYNPSDWAPAAVYRQMQAAPDYRKELDLFMVGPDGEYVALCTIWLDAKNGYANFEPVGTHTEYQGKGLGRALLQEGFRRMAAFGVTRSFIAGNVGFYRKIGFKEAPIAYYPWIKYFR
jgi:predicted N-acetyltransferase YhbS